MTRPSLTMHRALLAVLSLIALPSCVTEVSDTCAAYRWGVAEGQPAAISPAGAAACAETLDACPSDAANGEISAREAARLGALRACLDREAPEIDCDALATELADKLEQTSQDAACPEMNDQDADGTIASADCDDADATLNHSDVDDDGYSTCTGDCDDTAAEINPGATEVWYDGTDSDCAEPDDFDQDGDGARSVDFGGDDCDDTEASIYPTAADAWYDGVDGDCGGDDDYDQDDDGYVPDEYAGLPTAGVPTSGALPARDCDDTDASINDGATDIWYDGIDSDCAGDDDFDQDFDGHRSDAYAGDDCDDTAAEINPGATEVCDSTHTDEDCDGLVDDEDPSTSDSSKTAYYADNDSDGYGESTPSNYCEGPSGYLSTSTDCDDNNAAINPVAAEVVADGIDQNCDGVDRCYTDTDNDNYGTSVVIDGSSISCATGTGAPNSSDCDDTADVTYPGVAETCGDGVVNDCVGTVSDAITACLSGDFDLAAADATFIEEDAGDYAGISVASAGDVNGDGYDDLIVGANRDDDGGTSAGAAYLIFGPVTGNVDLSVADAKFIGENADDNAGISVASAGDVNRDGYDDLIVGANYNGAGGSRAGAAYLILGPITGNVDLSAADAKFIGEDNDDYAGYSVASAGDVNADGYDDILIGAYQDEAGGSAAGAAYLILGPVAGDFDLSAADAKFIGEDSSDRAGNSVASAGDVNADGYDDIIIGAYTDEEGGSASGSAYLVLGPVSGDFDLALADAKFIGEYLNHMAGTSVASAGDVNADGYDDLLVGAPTDGSVGRAYLILGPVSGDLNLSAADAELRGDPSEDGAGTSVASAGDVNGDGYDDVLVGAPVSTSTLSAATYVVLGPVTADMLLSDANAAFIGAGGSVRSAGDVDGDGYDDVIFGEYLGGFAYLMLAARY